MATRTWLRTTVRFAGVIGALLPTLILPRECLAIALDLKDDFEFGSTQNWANGGAGTSVLNVTTGGPGGAGDNYLQISSDGSGAAALLMGYNRAQWTGGYTAAGVGRIEMDLKNFGASPLTIRLALKNGTLSTSEGWATTNGFALPNDGQWRHAVFGISEADMTQLGTVSMASLLSLVRELRILHSAAPSLRGDVVAGQVGVDNIIALGPADTTPPSVTINQDAAQPDPGHVSPVLFRAVFSEPVTGFTNTDITFSGAGATTAAVTQIAPNNGTTYQVAISGMTSNGTITVGIPAGAASDAAGLQSLAGTSTDNKVTFIARPDTIAQAKMKADGVKVNLAGQTVSLVLPDRFFVEAPNRSSGIAVIPAAMPVGLAPARSVDVAGSVRTDAAGARYVDGAASVQGPAQPVVPAGMVAARLGGEDWLSDPITGAGQAGVTGGVGLNNVGRLVRVWGRVTHSEPISGGYLYYLDDGSRLSDGSGRIGVKVISQTAPLAVGQYDSAAGGLALEDTGSRIVPIILR